MSEDLTETGKPRALESILLGWLAVGVLDMCDAYFFFGYYYGLDFFRVFRGVAAGIYGSAAAKAGGVEMGLIGLALHYVVALGVSTVFYLLGTQLKFLYRQPWIWGPIYGIGVNFFMQYVVIPNSAIPVDVAHRYPPIILDWPLFNSVVGHALLIGLPVALINYWSAKRNTMK
jgi:hypothetical protein